VLIGEFEEEMSGTSFHILAGLVWQEREAETRMKFERRYVSISGALSGEVWVSFSDLSRVVVTVSRILNS
jgi:hypothetical protein